MSNVIVTVCKLNDATYERLSQESTAKVLKGIPTKIVEVFGKDIIEKPIIKISKVYTYGIGYILTTCEKDGVRTNWIADVVGRGKCVEHVIENETFWGN